MSVTVEQVRAALHEIADPCSLKAAAPASIMDLGLVYDIAIEEGVVRISMSATDPLCMMSGVFVGEAERRVGALPGVRRVEVELVTRRIWDPSRMSPDYAERLAAARAARKQKRMMEKANAA